MGFAKLRSNRLQNKSPYASDAEHQDHFGAAGTTSATSSISLPTLLSPRSDTAQSNYSTGSSGGEIHPGEALMKTCPDPAAPPLARRRKPKKNPPPRARSFYSTLGHDIDMDTSPFDRRGQRHRRRPSDNAASPTALPMKAMAILGFEEQRGFAFPAVSSPTLQTSREEEEDGYLSIDEDDEDEDDERDWTGIKSGNQREAMDKVMPIDSPGLAPDRVYFRPESLCSSFTSSEHTDTTTVTTMTPTSPSIGDPDPATGTLDSNSTLKEMSMLNLEDSEEEEQVRSVKKKSWTKGSVADLPPEIALQICDYFSTPTHHDDLLLANPNTTRCPNCELSSLWSLSQVSRTWNKAANAVLYRDISLDLGYYTPLRRDLNGNLVPPQYVKYTKCDGKHTQDDVEQKLRLLYNTIWRSQGEVGERIRGIKLPRRMLSLMKYPLLAILQKCPNLEYIDQAVVSSGEVEGTVSLLLGMKNMQRWTVAREASAKKEVQFAHSRSGSLLNTPPTRILTDVLPVWSQLKHLEIKKCLLVDIPTSFNLDALQSLESVRLEQTEVANRDFFARLPRLRKLAVVNCPQGEEVGMLVVEYLRSVGANLEVLELAGVDFSTGLLYELLQHTPNASSLVMTGGSISSSNNSDGSSLTAPTLPYLRTLHIDMAPVLDSIRFILAITEERDKVPELKKIHIGFRTAGYEPEPMLTETGNRGSTMLDEVYKCLLRIRMNFMWGNVEVII